jgi:hypothetical protein
VTEAARQLTTRERDLVGWLIDHGPPTAAPYRAGLEQLRVVATCGCGCPTVDFIAPPASHGEAGPQREIIAEAFGASPEQTAIDVILWAAGDRLASLEVALMDGATTCTLPEPDALTPLRER